MYLVLYFVVYVTLIVYKTKMPIQGPERVGVWILLVLAVIIGLWALIYAYTNTGNDGVKGVSGENGDQGLPGDQGLQGNQGLQGDTGPVASFTALPFTADNSVNLNVTAIQTGQLVIIEHMLTQAQLCQLRAAREGHAIAQDALRRRGQRAPR